MPPNCSSLWSARISECNGLTASSSNPSVHMILVNKHKGLAEQNEADGEQVLGHEMGNWMIDRMVPTPEALERMKGDDERYLVNEVVVDYAVLVDGSWP